MSFPFLLLALAELLTFSWADVGDSCSSNEGSGTCQQIESCESGIKTLSTGSMRSSLTSTGFTVTGACPKDPTAVKCCIKENCKSNTGTCLDKSQSTCAGGSFIPGYCPGPADIQCCVPSKPSCPKYAVFGVRGSDERQYEEGDAQIKAMGRTIGKYVSSGDFPAGTKYIGIHYDAYLEKAIDDLDPSIYTDSEAGGVRELRKQVQDYLAACPDGKVALAGYSQGAQVVHDALDYFATHNPNLLDNVRAVLLLADPKSDPKQKYHVVIDPFTGGPVNNHLHGLLGAKALPAAVRDRTTSACIAGDLVCNSDVTDASDILLTLLQTQLADLHSQYKTCCGEFGFWRILGGQFKNRLVE